jgi:large subunit ribosomal protein L6
LKRNCDKENNIKMSRIGKQLIEIPQGAEVVIADNTIKVKGPKGELIRKIPRGILVEKNDSELKVIAKRTDKNTRALHGTTRAHIANMLDGCQEGWSKTLELVGTGYRAEVQGQNLILTVGYSQPVKVPAPDGITFEVEKTDVTVSGVDKDLVGSTAAKIRKIRPPEPYQGKGIKYKDEIVRRKPGKAAKAGEAT